MFSVVMPVYNGEKFIETAIDSVFAQTEADWELIIVNDGSKDQTGKILEKYKENEKVRVITQENSGVSVARNNGMENAIGDYIVFLDADDIWHSNHLEIIKELIKKYPEAGLYGTFSGAELVNGDVIDSCEFFKDKDTDEVYLEDFFEAYHEDKSAKLFTVITTCIRKEALSKSGGFPVGCKIGEDLELSLRVAAYYPVVLSGKCTAIYKKVNSTATKDKSFDPDWKFFDTVENLYNDNSIPKTKKENLRKLMQWFSMRRFRHYLITGEREKALKVYRETDKRMISSKDRAVNSILILLPSAVVRRIFALRWRGQA